MKPCGSLTFISVEMKDLILILIFATAIGVLSPNSSLGSEDPCPSITPKHDCVQACQCGWCQFSGCFIYKKALDKCPNGTITEHNSARCKDLRLVFGNVGIATVGCGIVVVVFLLVLCVFCWCRWGPRCQIRRVVFARMRDEYEVI